MTINCKTIGEILQPLGSSDEFQVSFDISTWLGTDEISSVAYSAVDETGADATADVLTLANHANTTTIIKPYIKGGSTNKKQYTVKMLPTTVNGYKKAFYIKFSTRDIGE